MTLQKYGLIGLAAALPLAGAACSPRGAAQTGNILPSAAAQVPEARSASADSMPSPSAPPSANAPVAETAALRDAAAIQSSFAQVATAANPAVVTITTVSALPRTAPRQRPPGSPGGP